jgi:serine/threonine protein kinase
MPPTIAAAAVGGSSNSGSGSGNSGATGGGVAVLSNIGASGAAPGSPAYNAYARAALSPRSRRMTAPPRELSLSASNANARDDSTVISPFYEQYIQHTLAVLVFLANEESRAAFEREDALETLLQLCRFTTNNQVLRYCLGALLIQFTDDEDAWRRIVSDPQQEAVRIVLAAAESGVATLHREIRPSEVTLERVIFQSPLCEVVAGRWKNIEVAVKVFDVNSIAWSWDSFFSELAMLAISQHANVVRLYGAHSRRTSLRPFIVMELASGTVADMIDVLVARGGHCMLTTALALHVGAEIAFGLAFLHQRGLIHRDVKSANFLVNETGNVKFIDFGVSRLQRRGMLLNTTVGTPVWMAPEVLRGKGYGSKADIFSFALVLSHLLTGHEPFDDVPPLLVGDRVVGGLRPTLPRSVPAPLRALVTRCWSANESERLPAADIVRQFDEIRRSLHQQLAPLLHLPSTVHAALFSRCSFLMLCQLASTCSVLRNSVRAYRLNAMVPLDSLGLSLEAPYDATLRSYPWFHGNLSKQEATAMLRSMPAGAFLMRASSLPNHFVLCGQLEKQLLQILITPVKAPSGGYTIDIEGDQRVYPTIVKLLKMYRHVLKHAILRPVWEPRTTVAPFVLQDVFKLMSSAMKPTAARARASAAMAERGVPVLPNLGTDDIDQQNSGHFSPRARKLAAVRPPQLAD